MNPFLQSVLNVLSTMAAIDATPGKPALKQGESAHGDVTGVIGMTSPQAKGSLAISFSDSLIFDVARKMLHEEHSEINDTITDLVGEITNMVTGGAKKILGEKGYDFDMAIPAVVSGKNHSITHNASGPKLIMPFTADAGTFYVEICFET